MARYKETINPYFFIPFLLWCIGGAYLLLHYDSTFLFAAINKRYNPVLDTMMEWLSRLGEAWMIAILGLFCFLTKPFRNPWFFAAVVLCTVLPALLTQLIKFQVAAPRPMLVYENQPWVHHLDTWALLHNNSFPSGHTTGAFSFFCLLSCVVHAKYRFLGVVFFLAALATGYARVYLAAHFFVDVYVGSIVGTAISLMVYLLLIFFKEKKLARRTEALNDNKTLRQI